MNNPFFTLHININRDQLIKQMHISKNAFSQLIQTYGGTNFRAT